MNYVTIKNGVATPITERKQLYYKGVKNPEIDFQCYKVDINSTNLFTQKIDFNSAKNIFNTDGIVAIVNDIQGDKAIINLYNKEAIVIRPDTDMIACYAALSFNPDGKFHKYNGEVEYDIPYRDIHLDVQFGTYNTPYNKDNMFYLEHIAYGIIDSVKEEKNGNSQNYNDYPEIFVTRETIRNHFHNHRANPDLFNENEVTAINNFFDNIKNILICKKNDYYDNNMYDVEVYYGDYNGTKLIADNDIESEKSYLYTMFEFGTSFRNDYLNRYKSKVYDNGDIESDTIFPIKNNNTLNKLETIIRNKIFVYYNPEINTINNIDKLQDFLIYNYNNTKVGNVFTVECNISKLPQ